ncbi:putative signal transducing protein [Stutzerimonas tarimensis]|uniref:DUF2007 domain-containing protein n=1 Tax=Stutzerimonas tarimensis TaxID=1507735 RepID=A0ABV7SZ97_9GAMM
MRRIYEPRDLLEAEMLVGMLAAEHIDCHLLGAHLIGALGELPVAGLLALVVADEDADRARWLIGEYNGAEPMPGDEPESYPGDLIC